MASKYDGFWQQQIGLVGDLIKDASDGRSATAHLPLIVALGERTSWTGSATVRGSSVAKASMAHMVALARLVAASGLCESWPDQEFVFSMASACTLTVYTIQAADAPRSFSPPRREPGRAIRPSATRTIGDGQPVDATCARETIHVAVLNLPRYTSPSEVPFANGLYFFFEAGEDSPHGRPRITRIGNHPRAQDRLIGRLREHYATGRDAKNGSVFRRYLGGALLRRDGIGGCLAPGAGLGHWEMSNASECENCASYEEHVTGYLRSSFTFACVRIDDEGLRNHLEHRLIASVAQCRACQPSGNWLGFGAYPASVCSTGMWNTQDVNGPLATDSDIETFQGLALGSTTARLEGRQVGPAPASRPSH